MAVNDLLTGVTPENYSTRRQIAINSGISTPDLIPEQYDPNWIQSMQGTTSNTLKQLEVQKQQADIDMAQSHAQFFRQGGAVPAAIKIGNAIKNAASNGDWKTANSIALGGKLLEKGQQLTPDNFNAFMSNNGLMETSGGQPNLSGGYNLSLMPGAKEAIETTAETKEGGKQTVKYTNDLSKDAQAAINMHQAIAEMRQAMQNIQTGALAPAQGTMLKWARAVGYPLSKGDVANLSDQQVFTKVSNDIIAQMARTAGQASRLKGEFDAIKASNPNIGMEPESLMKLFDLLDSRAGVITTMEQAWNKQKQANPTLTGADFERNYIANLAGNQEQAGGALPNYPGADQVFKDSEPIDDANQGVNNTTAIPMPTNKTALVKGKLYNTPRGLAIWNGSMFEAH